MSALDFLARATWMLAEQERRSFSRKEDVPIVEEPFGWAVRRCREEGLPVRRIVWSGDEGRFRSPGKTEWLESRWPVSTAGAELVITVGLSQNGRRTTLPALRWWLTSVRSFGGLVASQGDEASPSRSVRFHVVRKGDSLGKPGLTGLYDRVRIHEVEVCHGSDGGVRLVARGFLAVLLAYFATGAGTLDVQWVPPIGTLRIACRGPEGPSLSARLVVAAALWWRLADLSSLFPLFSWATPQMADMCLREAESHPLKPCAWSRGRPLSRAGSSAQGDMAAFPHLLRNNRRRRRSGWMVPGDRSGASPTSGFFRFTGGDAGSSRSSFLAPVGRHRSPGQRPVLTSRGVTVPAPPPTAQKSWLTASGVWPRSRCGWQSREEWTLKSAVQLAHRWSREGRIAPLRRRLETRTLLYFSYGSCMCRPSFRETVPRFELIGEAVLRDFAWLIPVVPREGRWGGRSGARSGRRGARRPLSDSSSLLARFGRDGKVFMTGHYQRSGSLSRLWCPL